MNNFILFASFVEKASKSTIFPLPIFTLNTLFVENNVQRNTFISLGKTKYYSLDVKIISLNEEEKIRYTRFVPGVCHDCSAAMTTGTLCFWTRFSHVLCSLMFNLRIYRIKCILKINLFKFSTQSSFLFTQEFTERTSNLIKTKMASSPMVCERTSS